MKTIIYILAILLMVSPVLAENVTIETSNVKYSQSYYDIVKICNDMINEIAFPKGIYDIYTVSNALELHRQSLLMEKQNELLAEQNAILKNMTPKKMVCSNEKRNGEYGSYLTCIEWIMEE